jgi:putative endonuclease
MGMRINKQAFVYIMTNRPNGTLYVGAATNLVKRVWEHKQGLGSKFTSKYNLHRLIYFETHSGIEDAVARERRIKKWNRAWKIELIETLNPDWHELYDELCR